MNDGLSVRDPKINLNAITSFVLGIISVICVGTIILDLHKIIKIPGGIILIAALAVYLTIIFWITILGIILGMMALKSKNKKIAIIGIILCLIGLIGSIYIYLIALKIGTA